MTKQEFFKKAKEIWIDGWCSGRAYANRDNTWEETSANDAWLGSGTPCELNGHKPILDEDGDTVCKNCGELLSKGANP